MSPVDREDVEQPLGARAGRYSTLRSRVTVSPAIAVAALAAAAGVFVLLPGCGSDGGDGAVTATTQVPSTQGTSADPSQTDSTATEPPRSQPPEIPRIVVRDGRPVGGVVRLEYENGERVRFAVHSDVADEVHVHGFDITTDVPANGSVRFEFAASIEGVFEIELERARIEIAELRIRP